MRYFYFHHLWWIWQVVLVLASVFFMVFGIQILIKAYTLDDPFYFMMIFFASNLIILISAVLMAGFLYRMVGVFRLLRRRKEKIKK